MVVKLFALIKKNLILLLRSKSSALIVIFGPLLLILLMIAAFHTASPYGIIVGTYSDEYGPLTNALVDALKQKQMSIVQAESEERCVGGVKKGLFTVCAVFPADLTVEEGGTVKFFVDSTRENFVYIVIESLMSEVLKKSKSISEQLTAGVIDAVVKAGDQLEDKRALLEELAKNSQAIVDQAEGGYSRMSAVNISASMGVFPFDALQTEINDLKGSSNATTAADNYLKNIRAQVETLVEDVNYFGSLKLKSLDDYSSIRILTSENKEYATTLDANLDDVLRGIRGVKMQSVGKIVTPLDAKIESVAQEKNLLNYLFPTLVALIVMFVGLFLASSLEVRERAQHVHFKNVITPTSQTLFVLGNFLTGMMVIFLQLLVMFIVALFFFREQILEVVGGLSLILFLVAGTFVFFGMLIGTLFKSEETSAVAALSVGFILLFFSSTILPVEALPGFLQKAASYNPFYAAQFLLSKILLFQTPLVEILQPVLVLAGWFIGLFIMLMMVRQMMPVGD